MSYQQSDKVLSDRRLPNTPMRSEKLKFERFSQVEFKNFKPLTKSTEHTSDEGLFLSLREKIGTYIKKRIKRDLLTIATTTAGITRSILVYIFIYLALLN